MITLFRLFRLWQMRTKWRHAFWHFVDKQAMELIQNPEELEKKLTGAFAELIHEADSTKAET